MSLIFLWAYFWCTTTKLEVNFINVLRAKLLCAKIPREQKRLTTWLSFFPFQDLILQKRLIEYWWNWHQVSISSTFYECLFVTKCFAQLFSHCSFALWRFDERILAKKLLKNCWWNWQQGSISPIFYTLLLRV